MEGRYVLEKFLGVNEGGVEVWLREMASDDYTALKLFCVKGYRIFDMVSRRVIFMPLMD